MAKSYREWTAMQSYLMPPSPTEWLPQGHLACFVLDVVEMLEIGEIERAVQAKDWRGERPYPPRLMVALLLYGYAVGIVSSRRLARATYEDVPFRVIAGEAHPSFTTINQFRLDHLGAFRKLFAEVLRLCRRAGLVSLGHVAIDGSKIKANASKHKAMSYERMQQSEARIEQEVDEILARAVEADAAEDAEYGVGQMPEDVPAELHRREDRLARIRELKAERTRGCTSACRRAASERGGNARQGRRSDRASANVPPQRPAPPIKMPTRTSCMTMMTMSRRAPTVTCLITAYRRRKTARRGPRRSVTSPMPTAGSWCTTAPSCRRTTRRSLSTSSTRSSSLRR